MSQSSTHEPRKRRDLTSLPTENLERIGDGLAESVRKLKPEQYPVELLKEGLTDVNAELIDRDIARGHQMQAVFGSGGFIGSGV